ncbi:NADH-quinone oxidoreductase subunit L [Actinophytocola glycyrrhizae]|uniref:NADH-quinone oxidoreductase subunit L n=1 Tax=Actinophytocola glycyrrhizae TaxID=2044873 RepID=A0ABV9SJ16_9PSEU
MTVLLWLLPALPAGAGAGLLVAGRRADRWAPAVAVGAALATTGTAVAVAVGRPAVSAPFLLGLPVELAVDGLSAAMVVTVAVVTLAVLAYSTAELGRDEARARFHGFMLLFAAAMHVAVTATTVPPLLLAWEVMGAASYALIGFWWREPWRVRAATTAFVTTRTGDLGLYLAAGAAFAAAGSLDLDGLAALPAPWLAVVTAGVLLAAAGKSAQLPFSFWLSGAMAGPSPVSALLHSATMVAAGGYLLLRLAPVLHASGWGAATAAWLGAVTAVVLGAVACVQRDLKQLLAASTCAQVGFMVLAAGTGAVAGGAAQLAGHAAVKSLLFLAAGAWLTALGTKDLARLRGAGRRHPLVGVPFAVGALALAGVPPLTLWVTKDLALAGASTALHVAGLAAAALSALYAGRAVFVVLAPPTGADAGRAVPGVAAAVLAALALPAAGLGVALLARPGSGPHLEPLAAGISAVVAFAALALAALWVRADRPLPAPVIAAGERWLGLEALAHLLVARPVTWFAGRLARFDDRVLGAGARAVGRGGRGTARVVAEVAEHRLAALVESTGRGARTVASFASRDVERLLTGGVDAVAKGGRRLGTTARRPQTGQLHQYYAQTAVVLAVLALVFVLVLTVR